MQPDRPLAILACLCLFLAVVTGAFGAHGLEHVLSPERLEVWHTAVTYQMVHGLGLFALAWLSTRYDAPGLIRAGWVMFIGIVLFSGSLYVLAWVGTPLIGVITPIGGTLFLVAWGWAAWSLLRARAR